MPTLDQPTAAYLYLLSTDAPGLAWEYLRRNDSYIADWSSNGTAASAPAWGGCDFAEDPNLDARDADPAWLPDPDALIGVGPAVRDDSDAFSLWSIPGRKSLVHDGKRLLLKSRIGRRVVRLAVSLTLGDGQPYAYALPPGRQARDRVTDTLELAEAISGVTKVTVTAAASRPMLVHMRTLQALDAKRAGAADREIAELVLGASVTDDRWNDSAARAQVRYLLRAGRRLRDGGYRGLLRSTGKEVGQT